MTTKQANIACRPCTTDAMQRLADENEALRAERDGLAARAELLESTIASDDREVEKFLELRDYGEECFGRVLDLVLGDDREEWSSGYDYENAIKDVDERMAQLETRIDRLYKAADAGDRLLSGHKKYPDLPEFDLIGTALRETPVQSVAHIRADGAREALERAMKPGLSGTVVRVDVMREIIEQMEGE